MNEKLLEQILPIVEKTKEGILKGVEIAQEQFPELIKQVLAWHFTISLIAWLTGILMLIICGFCLRNVINVVTTECDKDKDSAGGSHSWDVHPTVKLGFSIAGTIICLAIGIVNLCTFWNWLQILIAPKLFLIEYISNLIK